MDGKLRMMTALYLTDGERILLLYRIGSKIADQSYVGCAGGHFESHEYNDARACVLRELYEETGLSEDALENLTLRYVTLRLKNGEIRENYYFFAKLRDPGQPLSSNEGNLQWVSLHKIDDLPMPVTAAHMLRHYREQGRYDTHLYGGITEADGIRFVQMKEF